MQANTAHKNRVLVIDDDPFFTDFIETCLTGYDIQSCLDGKCLEEKIETEEFDLIILDIDVDGTSGYDLCKELRKKEKHVPVLFVSGMCDLPSRLKAYDAGGNDYISKPFQQDELCCKVSSLIAQYQAAKSLQGELSQASSLILGVQTETSNLQEINRFVLHSSQCKDIESLYILFFHTLKELGTDGVLAINKEIPRSSKGKLSRLEQEILEMSDKLSRIYSFGKGRAYFGWKNCKLLVRNIGSLIDIIAILMDSLEICIHRIITESELIERVSMLENYNRANKDAVANLFNAMTDSISDELLMLGIVSSLNLDEEERIKQLMDSYSDRVQAYLQEQDIYNKRLKEAIEQMRTKSTSFEEYLQKISSPEPDSESVELF